MINLWINSETNALLPNWNAFGTVALPQIKQGDKIEFDIHWVKSDPSGQFMEEVIMPPASVIKVAVGVVNGASSGGYFTYSFEGDTIDIPYDADVDSFPIVPPPQNYVYVEKNANTLINSLPSIIAAGGVEVSIVNQKTFRIVFNQFGARALSSCDATPLVPSTTVSVIRINAGTPTSKEVQHLRPKVLPVAYSESFVNSPEPVISMTDIDSITKRISISPSPKFGTFTISNGTGTTSALSINSSASDLLNGLTGAGISSSTRTYSVAKSGDYSWDIYRTSGTSETLTITTNGIIGFSSKTGIVDFNTIEVEDLLAGQLSVNATLEVEYSYGTSKQTLYQGRVTIVNDIIEAATYNPIPFPEFGGGIGDAPIDGVLYGRKDGIWSPVIGDGNNIPDYDNTLIYTVGNQVYYQGKLYRMIAYVGAAGYDPVGYTSYWESLSGSSPDLSGYVEKTGAVMSLGATLNFLSSFSELSIGAGGVGVYSNTNPESVLLFENRLEVSNGTNTTKVIPAGITFPDLTTQTTAATTQDLTNYLTKNGNLLGITDASQARSNLGVYSTSQVDTSLSGKSNVGHNHNFFQLQKVDGSAEATADLDGHFLRVFNGATGGGNNFVVTRESNSWTFPRDGQPMPPAIINGTWYADDGLGNISSGTLQITISFSKYIFRLNTGTVGFETVSGPSTHTWVQSSPNYYLGTENYGDSLTVYADEIAEPYLWTYSDPAEGISASISITTIEGTGLPSWSQITFNGNPSSQNPVPYEFSKIKSTTYEEPVVKRGLLPSLTQELIREKAFSFPLDSSGLTKYGLMWDSSNGKFTFGKFEGSLYAKLAGDTFTGKVNITANSTFAPLNLGVQSANPSNTISGDLWIATNLQYRAFDGVLKTVANTNTQQTFSQPQVIAPLSGATLPALRITNVATTAYSIVVEDSSSPDLDATIIDASGNVGIGVSNNLGIPWTADAKLAVKGSTNLALLRLTQTGIGNVLLVEDETTPDATPFVIGPDGRIGIGGSVSATTTNKLAIYNGNIILTSGFGVIFGTGSTQTVPYIPSAVAITGGTIDNIIIDGGTF